MGLALQGMLQRFQVGWQHMAMDSRRTKPLKELIAEYKDVVILLAMILYILWLLGLVI
jgi:hypothetical protein